MSEHAKANAQAWYETICDYVKAVDTAETDDEGEAAINNITESALSVEVRDGWRSPGAEIVGNAAEEYMILLTTGGPALRIYGRLGRYSEPDNDPVLQWQEWGTPWTDWYPDDMEEYSDTLRAFAMQFYFGD